MGQIRGYDRNQVLIGTLLGDATLIVSSHKKRKAALRVKHKDANEDYIMWLLKYLEPYATNGYSIRIETDKKTGNEYRVLHINSTRKLYYMWKRFYVVNPAAKSIYTSGIKKIKPQILNSIGELALAVWYMDDGWLDVNINERDNVNRIRIGLATCAFTEHENRLLMGMLKKKFGIEANMYKRHNKYPYLTLNTEAALKFLTIVYKYVYEVESMRYKLEIPIYNPHRHVLIEAMESFRKARYPSKGNDIVQSFPKGER